MATVSSVDRPADHWRIFAAWLLVVLGSILAVDAALNVWANRQVLNTNHWTGTTSAMLRDDQIRAALSTYLVGQLYSRVDVTTALEQRLPKSLSLLAGPLTATSQQAAVRGLDQLLEQPAFVRLWEAANRRAHATFIALVDDKLRIVRTTNGAVVLDLHALLDRAALQEGFPRQLVQAIPAGAGRLVIVKPKQLETARTWVRVVRALSYVLGALVLAMYALAVYLAGAGRRRSMVLGIGVAVLAVGMLLVFVRRASGGWLIDSFAPDSEFRAASTQAWWIGTRLLEDVAVDLIVYGLFIVFAAWVAGPSRAAAWVRRALAPTLRAHPAAPYGVVALVFLFLLVVAPLDASRLIPLLVLAAFACVGAESFRRQVARELAAGEAP
jgi:hypothetical protein